MKSDYGTRPEKMYVCLIHRVRDHDQPGSTCPYCSKKREGDQPLPLKNDLPNVQDMLIADIEARKQLGIKRYGILLQPH
jgi:hypothetical protein